MVKRYSKAFPKEVADFIFENHKGRSHKEMVQMIADKFGMQKTPEQIKNYYIHHGLKTGRKTLFEKGYCPYNKGLKMSEEEKARRKHTFFPKGYIPKGTHKVGDLRWANGYKYIKIAEPNVWQPLHRFIWEQHNGPIPDGMLITFKDGNAKNITIENLEMLTRSEHCYLTASGLRFSDPEMTAAGINVARLVTKIKEKR